ncbi:hypothetical protein QBC38DRAFT_459605 [Podospora fimiseda]|uniref:Uncharacterized protein n=1 Tax=Podospora fimiseda TaxID=252190 RepID=A0AAN7GNJ0_9PEZI|nr:hypothetical protein QBC38DRAFT_459605 [Podospora fimiseda]
MSTSHRKLGQVVLNLQVEHIRSTIDQDIEDLGTCFRQILQLIGIFLLVTQRHIRSRSTSISVVNAELTTSLITQFLGHSNNILGFLDFITQQTGLPSGGDSHLEKQVQAITCFVKGFLEVLVAQARAADTPGKEWSLILNRNIAVYQGKVVHLNADEIDNGQVRLNLSDPNMDPFLLIHRFHRDPIGYPLRHVPGTQWHKFFADVQPRRNKLLDAVLFRTRKHKRGFRVSIPSTFEFIENDIELLFEGFVDMFESLGQWEEQSPNFRAAISKRNLARVEKRLANKFDGMYNSVDQIFNYDEDTSETPVPQYDILGRIKFEVLNFTLTRSNVGGSVLLEGDEHDPVDYLESDELFFEFQSSIDAVGSDVAESEEEDLDLNLF